MTERPSDPATVERLRHLCAALPDVTERRSHGEAAWFGVDPSAAAPRIASTSAAFGRIAHRRFGRRWYQG